MTTSIRLARRPWLAIALVAGGFAWSGCGGGSGELPTAPVSGTLSVKGKPVTKGMVYFHPKTGRTANGPVKDGKFTLTTYKDGDGAIVGTHRVAIEVVEEVPTKDGDVTTKSLIPEKFTSPDRSGIQVEIPTGGRQNLQIDVQDSAVAVKQE